MLGAKKALEERPLIKVGHTYLMDISHKVGQEQQSLSHVICRRKAGSYVGTNHRHRPDNLRTNNTST